MKLDSSVAEQVRFHQNAINRLVKWRHFGIMTARRITYHRNAIRALKHSRPVPNCVGHAYGY